MSVPIAVSIAGSDSSAGAGNEADLKTFAALGVYGATVVTALTAQNTGGVFAIHDVPADFVAAQINAVFTDLEVKAVKIGMLRNAPIIEAVAASFDRYLPGNVVLDPVLVASSGERLLREDALSALRDLISRVHLITPNLSEAAVFLAHHPRATKTKCAPKAKVADAWRRCGADQGRTRQRPGKRRFFGRGRQLRAARGATRRYAKNPRHRVHAGVGDCGWPR